VKVAREGRARTGQVEKREREKERGSVAASERSGRHEEVLTRDSTGEGVVDAREMKSPAAEVTIERRGSRCATGS
jgi:hypothetical protein